jgi:hypothetical protein
MDNKVVGYTSVLENKTKTSQKNQQKEVLLSQFIILPAYQGLGLGGTFLKIIYDHYLKTDKQCVNFSVEEPSDEF